MKKILTIALTLALAAALLTGCGTTAPASSAATSSETPVSVETPSVETSSVVASSEETSAPATSEPATSTPATSDPAVSKPETSVPETPVTPSAEGFDKTASAKLIAAANEKRTAAGLTALEENARLSAAAEEYINRLAAAGIDFIKSTDYKTLPDGTKVTSLVNSLAMDAQKMSGINYSIWINEIASNSNTVDALTEKAIASAQFDTKVAGGFSYIGSAAYGAVADGITQYTIVVVYYAGGAY